MNEKKADNTSQHDDARDRAQDAPEQGRSSASDMVEVSEEAAEVIRHLESERDDAIAARQRALADFQNYQRRAIENERRAQREGAVNIVRGLLPVLDHFDLAIDQSPDQLTVEQLLGGVKIVRDELRKALEASGVERIDPQRGDAFDPNTHEAMMRESVDDVEPGCVSTVLQPGYRMGEQVLRPAKVGIAQADDDEDQANADDTDESKGSF